MKKIFVTVFLILVGSIFVNGFIDAPVEKGNAAYYHLVFSLVATTVGFAAFFLPKKLNERNARYFQKLYQRTKFPWFKRLASDTRGEEQSIVTPVVGFVFLVIGITMLTKSLLAVFGI